ncbi:MAG: SDR family oxidoreductase [Planctomycetota bacterium]|nr:SDR family oxidoreductase [Planctomycetota bacterium]
MNTSTTHRVLLTGGTGRLGTYLVRELRQRRLHSQIWSTGSPGFKDGIPVEHVDLLDVDHIAPAFQSFGPTLVIHAAAISTADACLANPVLAQRLNVDATKQLSDLCRLAGARLIYTSTDLVFDGRRGGYRECDPPSPVMVYGRSKAEAEPIVLQVAGNSVVRLSLLFGPKLGSRDSFFDLQWRAITMGDRRMKLFTDEWRTPIDYQTASRAVVEIALADTGGIWHVGGPERMSRWEMGERLARFLGQTPLMFEATNRDSIGGTEPRPEDVSLDSSRWRSQFAATDWPNYEEALRMIVSPLRS